jgi:hypothetical protein
MDPIAMNAPVAVLERVGVYETERQHRGRDDGIELLDGTPPLRPGLKTEAKQT